MSSQYYVMYHSQIQIWYISKHDSVSRKMQLIDQSFERLVSKVTESTTKRADASMGSERILVVPEDTILINPMKNVPLKVVSESNSLLF